MVYMLLADIAIPCKFTNLCGELEDEGVEIYVPLVKIGFTRDVSSINRQATLQSTQFYTLSCLAEWPEGDRSFETFLHKIYDPFRIKKSNKMSGKGRREWFYYDECSMGFPLWELLPEVIKRCWAVSRDDLELFNEIIDHYYYTGCVFGE